MPSQNDELKRFEELLEKILSKLELIEAYLRNLDPRLGDILKLSGELISLFSIPPLTALNAAYKILNISKFGKLDEISKVIIEVLSVEDGISISELTRRVKIVRGRASRKIIRERVLKLEEMGLVKINDLGNKKLIYLNI